MGNTIQPQNNIEMLRVSTEKLEPHFIAYLTDKNEIDGFTHNDLINDWHIERIRRFNIIADYLINSLLRMNYYAAKLVEGETVTFESGIQIDTVVAHRQACREALINIDIYIEAVKSFCRYYFFLDEKFCKQTDRMVKTLLQYKPITGWKYIEDFLSQCQKVHSSEDLRFAQIIRDNEMHNESPIALIRYKFQSEDIIPEPLNYVISNETLHNLIVNSINILISLAQSLQNMIVNVSPLKIYHFLEKQDGKLAGIIKMEDRYKNEREVFNKYYKDSST